MMQRAKKTEKGRSRSAFSPERSRFGMTSFASPDVEQQKQAGLCGPLCDVNLIDLPVQSKAEPNHTGLPDQLKVGIESLSTGKVVQAAAKKKEKPKPMSLSAFHEKTQAPQKSSSQIWNAQPQTVKMAPPPAANVVKQSDSGKANEIINLIEGWNQSSHDGCDGKDLTYEEIMQIRGWAEKKKTKNGNSRYSVIFGQGSGKFAEGYQMKIVGLNPLTISSGDGTKKATFHITINDNFNGTFE